MSERKSGKRPIYRMPTGFGPAVGPRQAPEGVVFDPTKSPEKFCAYVTFRTDGGLLEQILPEGFTLRGEPTVTFEFSYMTEIDWLAGRGYNMLTVRIPVRFKYGNTVIDGFFQPVAWENMAEPIISGREELGWSKLFADLPPPEKSDGKIVCCAEWMGFKFLELTLADINNSNAVALATMPVLHRKYIPATEQWGEADIDYVTMTPVGGSHATVHESFTADASLSLFAPTWEDMPTQHECIIHLACLPKYEYLQAGVYSTVGGKSMSDQIRFY
ncbi:acetoacetate decarboxylase family protein [Pseudomonas sp. VI4.1]|uniref:acetoacetate decarboxylase family protein n=1 Tax=Pseudomonas sp. VI4.1 TaxID=1941346 RepID=UPI0009D58B76|nr:acetoacetate decarboxylase family protein [Pseudomonas sp. VI4.1]OPK10311.1 hypothetical protein BZ163_10810 [Pseudomonas sp. VI4.1]